MTVAPSFVLDRDASAPTLRATGSWNATYVSLLEQAVEDAFHEVRNTSSVRVDMSRVQELDTFGAWLIEHFIRRRSLSGRGTQLDGLEDHFKAILAQLRCIHPENADASSRASSPLLYGLGRVGKGAHDMANSVLMYAGLLGAVGEAAMRSIRHPAIFRLTSLVHHIEQVGWRAVPIICLINFLIGGIIAQQGIFHFRKFGAETYVVDMVGVLVLREIGVLIVSIMVAGRSGSSYTAELGSMKMREEIDALRTMGLETVDVLILPRILALIVALPVLTFLGSMSALYGAGLVTWLYGGMHPDIFMERLREAVSLAHFNVGMIKAPFMAAVIGIVACTEGLRVTGSAQSLGEKTTASVVHAIFLVIVLDGLFAIFFAAVEM